MCRGVSPRQQCPRQPRPASMMPRSSRRQNVIRGRAALGLRGAVLLQLYGNAVLVTQASPGDLAPLAAILLLEFGRSAGGHDQNAGWRRARCRELRQAGKVARVLGAVECHQIIEIGIIRPDREEAQREGALLVAEALDLVDEADGAAARRGGNAHGVPDAAEADARGV